MAGDPLLERRRSSFAMYDPARDIFTQSDELGPVIESDEHSISQDPSKQNSPEHEPVWTGPKQTAVSPTEQVAHTPPVHLGPTAGDLPNTNSGRELPNMDAAGAKKRQHSSEQVEKESSSLPPAADLASPTLPPVKKRKSLESPSGNSPKTPAAEISDLPSREPDPPRGENAHANGQTTKEPQTQSDNLGQATASSTTPSNKATKTEEEDGDNRHQSQRSEESMKTGKQEKPTSNGDLPSFKRKRREDGTEPSKRRRSPPSAYDRRDRPRERSRSPQRRRQADRYAPISPSRSPHTRPRSRSPRRRSPDRRRREIEPQQARSPSPLRRSPPPQQTQQRKRPGKGAHIGSAEKEAWKRRQEEREREQQREATHTLHERGVQAISNQHYNSLRDYVKENGREWRTTGSRISGLRPFNNWIKSTVIQKFSPDDTPTREPEERGWAEAAQDPVVRDKRPLLVLDIGCGRGGDLFKWEKAPERVDLYVGLDPAEQSIKEANKRYADMGRRRRPFDAHFFVCDCFQNWIGDIDFIRRVGIDPNVGPSSNMMSSRWGGGGGFDVVSMMFSMHYSFQSEQTARMMLRNVAGSLKKGGRFIGVGPNSDAISARVAAWHAARKAKEPASNTVASTSEKQDDHDGKEHGQGEEANSNMIQWGNSIYKVVFKDWRSTPEDGIFRPPFGHAYQYFLEEAVENVPEYVVPWEAFRALAEEYNLEQRYRKPFMDIWDSEKDDPILGPLSVRMGVRKDPRSPLNMSSEEVDAASFYHAWCFTKV